MHKHLLEFCRLTGELLESEPVRMMGRWQHHGRITTLDHSLFVAYLSFRAARWLRLDERAAAAGACSTTCTSMTPGTSPPTPAASASTTPGPQPECRAGDQALR